MKPKFPQVNVQLSGEDSNAFFILGRVVKAMRLAVINKAECSAFRKEAMSGDYDGVLQAAMRYVSVS